LSDDDTIRRSIADWIMQAALRGVEMPKLIEGTSNRLLAAGVPLSRSHVSFRTLHPSFESVSMVWYRGRGISEQEFAHGAGDTRSWMQSPFHFMVENRIGLLRRPLVGSSALLDFPILQDLSDEGFTDYLAMVVPFDSMDISIGGNRQDGIASSWVTDREGGFSDTHLMILQNAVQRLGVACKLSIREQIARNVADAYLGQSAGREVLGGHIRLGDYETFTAIAWYADLRDSTGRVERLGMERYLALLNGFLGCTAGAVQAYGGEILAYPGDAVLAIFRDDDPAKAAQAAIIAAAEARRRLFDVNANLTELGQETLEAGLALHRGELAFGNIGTGGRQSFTVIGPAINVVNRLEQMTKNQPFTVIVSDTVAALLPAGAPALTSLGQPVIRGSGVPLTAYGATNETMLRYRAPPGYAETILAPLSNSLEPA
jgi:adenylate cyclase